jgi:hypothetical protein
MLLLYGTIAFSGARAHALVAAPLVQAARHQAKVTS